MFGDMVLGYMPNSDPWAPPGTPFITICVFYVNRQIPNIADFEAYAVPHGQNFACTLVLYQLTFF